MEMMNMKKIIILIILLIAIISCSELAELEAGHQQRMKERGYECTYNSKGEVQVCGYMK